MQKIQFASYNCFCMAVPYCGLILIEKNPWNIDALAKIFSFVIRELLISGEKTVNLKTSHFPGVSFSVWQYPVEKWMRWSKYILLFLLIPDLSLNEKKKKKFCRSCWEEDWPQNRRQLPPQCSLYCLEWGQPGHGPVIHIISLSFCGPRKLTFSCLQSVIYQTCKPQHSWTRVRSLDHCEYLLATYQPTDVFIVVNHEHIGMWSSSIQSCVLMLVKTVVFDM